MKYFLLTLFSFVLGFIAATVFFSFAPPTNYKEALSAVAQADEYLKEGGSSLSLKLYKEAEEKWPPLKLLPWFQDKKKTAEKQILEKAAVIIYLKDATKDSEKQSLISELKSFTGVRKIKIISKQEALKIYLERFKNNPELTEYITEDLLPETLEVYMDDHTEKNKLVSLAKSKSFVDEVTSSL